MATLGEIEAQVSRLDVGSRFLKWKEIKALPGTLWDGERLEMIVSGQVGHRTALLIATDRRLIITDKGLVSGLRLEAIPYNKVPSVQYQSGMLLGKIFVYIDGGTRRVVENVQKVEAIEFGDYISNKISSVHAHTRTTPKQDEGDIATLIERLAGLRDRGIISEDEFTEKKRAILGL